MLPADMSKASGSFQIGCAKAVMIGTVRVGTVFVVVRQQRGQTEQRERERDQTEIRDREQRERESVEEEKRKI